MWTQLSVENITPGLNLCDELSVTTTNADQLKKNLDDLNVWSSKASDSIKTVAAQVSSTYHAVRSCLVICQFRNKPRF